ncbi:MAG: cobyric acid synthase [Tindallia sp. MSAO_Bac2]|nr:MAG: cobyric acid synthase [Tindallia sp. MSAO_Bac2]
MLQGTASSVGKSVLTAAFCRIFKEDGYRVVPFKSQNMALNSFITDDGLEMGRAQVFQAEAAGVTPKAGMNPILLKPTGEKEAQVIINGKVFGNMNASEYHAFKPELKTIVHKAYNQLRKDSDIVVIEGAGSPAEINLKKNDIVNMGMAKMVNAPVILVGDIDRGGVFASIYGTVMLLDEDERRQIKGVLINKFRGDLEILKPGLKQLEDLIGIPVLGVIPYGKFDIEEEDGEAERLKHKSYNENNIDIRVIRLPRISNFTDFHWLATHPSVNLQYIDKAEEVGTPDLLIIPGTKNTLADLEFLKENEIDRAILKARNEGAMIAGICGGFQMLGKKLLDPHMVESKIGELDGLGLLDVETTFFKEKMTTQTSAEVLADNFYKDMGSIKVNGYEIHMGKTCLGSNTRSFAVIKDENELPVRWEGAVSEDKRVWGTYLHGIFDNEEFNRELLQVVANNSGAENMELRESFAEYKEKQYRLLADTVRESVDLESIYAIMEGECEWSS